MNCIQCGNPIPRERIDSRRISGGPAVKYCSKFCIKRNFYIKNISAKHSAILDGANFDSETQKGLYWENYIAKILSAVCVSNRVMNQPTDLIWNGYNIDVKSSNIYKRKMKRGKPVGYIYGVWNFNRNSFKDSIDFFVCVCLIGNALVKIYMIPSSEFPKSGICIGKESKYDRYLFNGSSGV